jgi:predicted Zn-dependent protease
MGRLEMLQELLTEFPDDAFARYGLAMEYANSGDSEAALREFATLLEKNPDYTAGYFMAAQTLAKANRADEAREMLKKGIASAERTNDAHARSEMEGMLAELG